MNKSILFMSSLLIIISIFLSPVNSKAEVVGNGQAGVRSGITFVEEDSNTPIIKDEPVSKPTSSLPKTGELKNNCILIAGFLILLIVALSMYSRRRAL